MYENCRRWDERGREGYAQGRRSDKRGTKSRKEDEKGNVEVGIKDKKEKKVENVENVMQRVKKRG